MVFIMYFPICTLLIILWDAILADATFFNISAISANNGISVIQCWQLTEPLTISQQQGVVGSAVQQLGSLANASYNYLPAHFPGTPHPAPVVQ